MTGGPSICARRRLRAAAVLLPLVAAVLLIDTGCGAGSAQPTSPAASLSPGASSPAPPPAGSSPATSASVPASSPIRSSPASPGGQPQLAYVFLIVMENKSASQIIGSRDAPFINRLARHYSLATNYRALFHPSLPNYIALTSGSNQGITDDRSPPTAGYAVSATNLADRIQAAGRTWKSYAESIPSPGYASSDQGLYATRHVPFLYYTDILRNAARRKSHVVPFARLAADLRAAAGTPDFAFITPNLCHDMHDCPVRAGDTWLARVVPAILRSPAFSASPSLLVITWDEGTGADQRVATVLAGSGANLHYRSGRPYTHYSLLHTIEAEWGLRPLTSNDASAATMSEFLRK